MRYIYYIFIIILVTTLGVWGANRALTPDFSEEAALTVNNRIISQAELESRKKYSPYHFRSREDFLNDLITRELLIQEARRRGIDRDEAFRMTMEDQYEQALIKQVMDHRMVEINIEITEQERTDFQRASLNRYQLQQLNYASPDGATAGAVKSRQQMNENFLDLPALWQLQLLSLNTGESSSPFPLDNGYCVLKILGITPLASPRETLTDEEINQQLTAARRQLSMDRWLDGLRRNADIQLSAALRQEGGNDEPRI